MRLLSLIAAISGSALIAFLIGCGSGSSAIAIVTPIPPTQDPAKTIPSGAFMKYQPFGTTNYVFNASVMLAPPQAPADASATIQAAINAIANATLSKGGVIFLAPGTYLLKNTLKLQGTGVTLVGVRRLTTSGQNGTYPTLVYDDTLIDADYNNHAAIETVLGYDVPLLDSPAAIRFNGNNNYATTGEYSYGGLIGLNISYVGTAGSVSEGDIATAFAVNAPHQVLFRDITINNAYAGIDVGPCTSPYFWNIAINNVRGNFGARLGDSTTTAMKMHALTVNAASTNTNATLVIVQQNMELIGASLSGGKIGISISGPSSSAFADDIYIRSAQIQNTSQQGILIRYARDTYISDTSITNAGAEAVKVLPGFYGGLAFTNLYATNSGLSAVRVQQGMNISFVNAVLLNSGLAKATASTSDLPIASISIDSSVTSLNVTGMQLGDVTSNTPYEDWGIYLSAAPPLYTPWHSPTILASYVDFMNLPTAQQSKNITPTNVGGYATLNSAGYFNPPLEDSWTLQNLPTDPVFTGPAAVVKGFNTYDIPEVRDRQWINLTSSALSNYPVIDSSGTINATNFAYWESLAAVEFPEGVVFYLPSGFFNTSYTSYTREIYNLLGTISITQPNIEFVGDGRYVTQIYNTNAVPTNSSISLNYGSTGSGIYGLSLFYSQTAALTAPGTATNYGVPITLQNTSQIRLGNIGVRYSMGGGVAITDTTNSELFDTDMNFVGANNSQPTVPLGVYTVTATTNESTSDIRFYETFGEFLENIWIPASSSFCANSDACDLPANQIPDLEWIRLVGGVTRFRIDSATEIEGKTGYVATANTAGVPHVLSSFKFSTDHAYTYGVDLQQAVTADFDEPWMNARVTPMFLESGVSGNIRISTEETRGGAFEGDLIQGGTNVALVNCEIGLNNNLWTPYNTLQTRPLAGVFLGAGVGNTTFVGGDDGWLADNNYSSATTNANDQSYGIVLATGAPLASYTVYGMDLYGNKNARIGLQTSGGVGASVVQP